MRGIGDECALRLRYHDEAEHQRRSPQGGPAQEMFQWIEDARIASIGSMRMQGVAQNLDASLEAQCKQAAFDTITVESEAPLSSPLGCWCASTSRAGSCRLQQSTWCSLARLRGAARGLRHRSLKERLLDQEQFRRVCRDIMVDLGLEAELRDPTGRRRFERRGGEPWTNLEDADSDVEPRRRGPRRRIHGGRKRRRRDHVVEMDADVDMADLGAEAEPEDAPPNLPDEAGRIRVDVNYQRLYHRIRRGGKGRRAVRHGRTDAPADAARPAAPVVAARHLETRQPSAAEADGKAESHLGVRPRGGHSGQRRGWP